MGLGKKPGGPGNEGWNERIKPSSVRNVEFTPENVADLLLGLSAALYQYRCLDELPECKRVVQSLKEIHQSLVQLGAYEGSFPAEALERLLTTPDNARTINTAYGILNYFRAHEKSVAEEFVEANPAIPMRVGSSERNLISQLIDHFDLDIARYGKDAKVLAELNERTRRRNAAEGRNDPPPNMGGAGGSQRE